MGRLFERIRDTAPTARLETSERLRLGRATLSWRISHQLVPEGSFPHSGWDVIAGAELKLSQEDPAYPGRSASLWYTDLGGGAGYRWVETPYMTVLGAPAPTDETPFAVDDLEDADLAASNVTHVYQHAARPHRSMTRTSMPSATGGWSGLPRQPRDASSTHASCPSEGALRKAFSLIRIRVPRERAQRLGPGGASRAAGQECGTPPRGAQSRRTGARSSPRSG